MASPRHLLRSICGILLLMSACSVTLTAAPPALSEPDPNAATIVTDAETGIGLPTAIRFEALQQALNLIGTGLQRQKYMGMDIKVSVTGLYLHLPSLDPFWVGKSAPQLAADQPGFYDRIINAPASKAVVMVMNVGASVKIFRKSLTNTLNKTLQNTGEDVDAKVDQLMGNYHGGKRVPKGTKVLIMWRQPADLLVSFIDKQVQGFATQSPDETPMRNESLLLKALFGGYLGDDPAIPALKQDVAVTMASMK